jgi:uncharacterized protein (DUF4415 family)
MKQLPETQTDAELHALMELRDDEIDTSDIPETLNWSGAVPGRFYRPIKEPVTLRLDVDVIGWVKSEGPGYQTRINALLRKCMLGTVAPHGVENSPMAREHLRFPALEKQGELERYASVAMLIQQRGSLFSPVG